jgi:hypothetical protein
MEAWDRGQRGEYLGEGQGLERIGRHSSGNTVLVDTDFPDARILGVAASLQPHQLAGVWGSAETA